MINFYSKAVDGAGGGELHNDTGGVGEGSTTVHDSIMPPCSDGLTGLIQCTTSRVCMLQIHKMCEEHRYASYK